MAALPEDEPFSPSDFLNLPPTPHPDGDAVAPTLQQQDDGLLLPFITRVLMEEEDIDDNPDHTALLEAQQPFAEILSDAAASSTTKSSGFDSAADGSVVPFSDAPVFAANAT
ncbi:hypothetical protein BAE44_0015540 [Dichanthelium oligosanthes]|uniref:Uncharacterized protein n=1 Tax=Dichanthelium oligosanthes TaxID=888268 RepID=A0A1E5VE74_9POAL|nr:hypothetical protein BAE44_0015540 [Dichanthelium oligosanthes]